MRKKINISGTIKQLSVGERFDVPFKDMSDGSVKATAYRIRGRKYSTSVDKVRGVTVVTRVS